MHLALQPAAEILNRPPGKVVADLGGLSASSICFPKDAAANLAALRTGEVHVWLSFIHSDPVAEKLFWNTLSAEERQRAEKIQVAADRAGFVLAHALVRAVLSQYHSTAPGAWQFGHGVQGKPFISAPAGAPPLQFNLSHTNGLVACAVMMAVGHHSGNPQFASRGKSGLIWCLLAALLIGGSNLLINTFFHLGSTLS